ncbi:MAG: hypothetical protein ACLVE2_15680 [Bacteroides caccae]
MKKCEKYNMKTEFEKLRDFDFTVSYVRVFLSNGNRVTKLIPVNQFSLFGITVVQARNIVRSFNLLPNYICTISLISD